MRHLIWIAMELAGIADPSEPHVAVKWPLSWCEPSAIAAASPAPATSNSDSLLHIPFSVLPITFSAAVIVSLTPDNRPVIECVVDPGYETGFELEAVNAVADMVFSAPLAVNKAGPGGRYLVRVSTLFGVSWVDPPPPLPILPACERPNTAAWVWNRMPNAPKPAARVQPSYPRRALDEEIEGEAIIALDIFSNGDAIPLCLAGSTPPGWFENAALSAVSQWRFEKGVERGKYQVTVRFRLED